MILEKLYESVLCDKYNYMSTQKQITFENGSISYSDSHINFYINDKSTTIKVSNPNIIHACSYDNNIYVLISDSSKTYILETNCMTSTCYLLLDNSISSRNVNIEGVDCITLTCHDIIDDSMRYGYMNVKGMMCYICSKDVVYVADLSVTTSATIHYIAECDICCGLIVSDVYKLDVSPSPFSIYDGKVIIPQISNYIVIDTKTSSTEIISNSIDGDIYECIQYGDKTEYMDKGIVSLYSTRKSLCLCDNEDIGDYIIADFSSTPKILHINKDIFVYADSALYKLDTKDYSLYAVTVTKEITDSKLTIANNNITIISQKEVSQLSLYNGTTSVLNVICKLDEHTIHSESTIVKKAESVVVQSPTLYGYTSNDAFKEIKCSSDYNELLFEYTFNKPVVDILVKCICREEVLHEYVVSGPIDAEYNIEPIDINGYLLFRSSNNSGVFDKASTCVFEYIPANTESQDMHRVVKINALYNSSHFITRYMCIDSDITSISAPSMPGMEPISNSAVVPKDYNICDVYFEYNKTSNVVYPVVFTVDGHSVYETTAIVHNEDLIIEDIGDMFIYDIPSYDSIDNEQTVIFIQCTPKNTITLYDIYNANSLYKFCIYNDSELYIPRIENNTFNDYRISHIGKLKIYSLHYLQNIITIKVSHMINDKLYSEDFYNGSTGDAITITPINIDTHEYYGDTVMNFGNKDSEVVFNYIPKIITISAIIKDNYNNIISNTSFIFKYGDEQIIKIDIDKKYMILYKDTEVNESITVNFSKSSELIYIVCNEYKSSTSHVYTTGFAIVSNELTNPYVYISSERESNNSLYVLNDNVVDISGTVNYLLANFLNHSIITVDEIHDLAAGSVIINGDINTLTLVSNDIHSNNKIIINIDKQYTNLSNTIRCALKNCISTTIPLPSTMLSAEASVRDVKYNKVSSKAIVDLDIKQRHVSDKIQLDFNVCSLNTGEVVCTYKYPIYTTTNISKCYYTLNDRQIDDCGSTLHDINNIYSIIDLPDNNIIEKYLHIIFEDDIGNKTEQHDLFIAHKVTPIATINSFNKLYISTSSIRYNNRFNGPRESYKLHNTYASIDRDIEIIESELNNIKKTLEGLSFEF